MKKIIPILTILILLMSCSNLKVLEVPVETIRTEYIYGTTIDSVYEKDSIDRWLKGDTLYIYKEHTKVKYLNKIDSIVKTDTITKVVKVDVVKEVEVNHIKWYQKALMWIGGVISLMVFVYIMYKIKLK